MHKYSDRNRHWSKNGRKLMHWCKNDETVCLALLHEGKKRLRKVTRRCGNNVGKEKERMGCLGEREVEAGNIRGKGVGGKTN